MKLLITGALGHIGSSLFRFLLNQNLKINQIYIIDNFLSQRYSSLFDTPKSKVKLKFIDEDLSKVDIKKLPYADIIIHLAAKTDAAQSAKFKNEFYTNNLKSTKNIIDYCKLNNSKLIFASSTSVYGPQKKVVNEDCASSELNPQSPYAAIKLKEENLIKKNLTKSKFLILRLGTICGYSKGIRFHTAVNKFCFQAATGKPLTIWKTALNQRRPYLTLEDLNRAIIFIINNKLFYNTTFNLVSDNLTVKQILNQISKNIKIRKIFVEHEIMNQLSYTVNTDKFKKYGFKFLSNIDKSINKTLKLLGNINE